MSALIGLGRRSAHALEVSEGDGTCGCRLATHGVHRIDSTVTELAIAERSNFAPCPGAPKHFALIAEGSDEAMRQVIPEACR